MSSRCQTVRIKEDVDLMVNTALPKDLGSMGVSSYIHDTLQLRWAVLGVEDARMAKYVGMSMLQ